MPELDQKATTVFAGKVVRKDLVRKVKAGANVPVFVLEYLLGKYCATDDPVAIDAGMQVVNSTLLGQLRAARRGQQSPVVGADKGKHTLIDKVKVRYISDDDKYWAELVNFGHVRPYPRTIRARFRPPFDGRRLGASATCATSTTRTQQASGARSGSRNCADPAGVL